MMLICVARPQWANEANIALYNINRQSKGETGEYCRNTGKPGANFIGTVIEPDILFESLIKIAWYSMLRGWLLKCRMWDGSQVNGSFYLFYSVFYSSCGTLRWRHDHDGVSNHQPHVCLLNCLFGCISKKTSKLRVTGLCVGNSP